MLPELINVLRFQDKIPNIERLILKLNLLFLEKIAKVFC